MLVSAGRRRPWALLATSGADRLGERPLVDATTAACAFTERELLYSAVRAIIVSAIVARALQATVRIQLPATSCRSVARSRPASSR